MSEQDTEKNIKATGKTAPRLTPEDIDRTIVAEQFIQVPGTVLTICVLTLRNGFTATGESAPVSAENFDEKIGQDIARENARNKVWMLEGYLLKQSLYEQEQRRMEPQAYSDPQPDKPAV